jgi:hypothetical protein
MEWLDRGHALRALPSERQKWATSEGRAPQRTEARTAGNDWAGRQLF